MFPRMGVLQEKLGPREKGLTGKVMSEYRVLQEELWSLR